MTNDRICHGCGCVVGRECFNPEECIEISYQRQREMAEISAYGSEQYTATLLSKIKELEAKIAEMQAELKELKKPKQVGLWKPKHGGKYYYLDQFGGWYPAFWEDYNPEHLHIYDMGNCFETKEAAERHREKLKVLQKIREIAASDGWVADWEDALKQRKHSLCFDYSFMAWVTDSTKEFRCINTAYMSAESARRCIAELGDELNVLLEG